jgi:hypothetical protein
MLIDTHLHESKYSKDSKITLQQIITRAKELGLDGICITDHSNNFIRNEIDQYSKDYNFLIIAGAEILTKQGDILTFIKDKLCIPDNTIDVHELMEFIDAKSGVGISAHPYRNNNRGLGDYIRKVYSKLSGIEAFNGSTFTHQNLSAFAIGKELNISCTGGSDAHVMDKIGVFATYFKGNIRDETDFIEAIKSKQFCPAILKNNKYEVLNMF